MSNGVMHIIYIQFEGELYDHFFVDCPRRFKQMQYYTVPSLRQFDPDGMIDGWLATVMQG
jgi:hypothetical protein